VRATRSAETGPGNWPVTIFRSCGRRWVSAGSRADWVDGAVDGAVDSVMGNSWFGVGGTGGAPCVTGLIMVTVTVVRPCP
jgi:hypothetical protein